MIVSVLEVRQEESSVERQASFHNVGIVIRRPPADVIPNAKWGPDPESESRLLSLSLESVTVIRQE